MKKIFSILLLVLVAIGGAFAVSTYNESNMEKGSNYNLERHEIMQKAFENRDYFAWRDIMDQNIHKGKVYDVVNASNFEMFVLARESKLSGNMEKFAELRAQLSLNGDSSGEGFKNGKNSANKQGDNGFGRGKMNGNCKNFQ